MIIDPRQTVSAFCRILAAKLRDRQKPHTLLVSRFGVDFLDPEVPAEEQWPLASFGELAATPGLRNGRISYRNWRHHGFLTIDWEETPGEQVPVQMEALTSFAAARLQIPNLLYLAAGTALLPEAGPGVLVPLHDHIRWDREDPLRGWPAAKEGARFPQLQGLYSPRMLAAMTNALGNNSCSGVGFIRRGPAGATCAELEAARRLGADVVMDGGSSEAIAARHAGLHFGAICMTLSRDPLDQFPDPYVMAERAEQILPQLGSLLLTVLPAFAEITGSESD